MPAICTTLITRCSRSTAVGASRVCKSCKPRILRPSVWDRAQRQGMLRKTADCSGALQTWPIESREGARYGKGLRATLAQVIGCQPIGFAEPAVQMRTKRRELGQGKICEADIELCLGLLPQKRL